MSYCPSYWTLVGNLVDGFLLCKFLKAFELDAVESGMVIGVAIRHREIRHREIRLEDQVWRSRRSALKNSVIESGPYGVALG